MHPLTQLIREDMCPALGVTEPGAIALAVATARRYAPGAVYSIRLRLNSGMYKNAFTCGIPGSDALGTLHAAALGAVAADPDQGLQCLAGVTPAQAAQAAALVAQGRVQAEVAGVTSRIFIEAEVQTAGGTATAVIQNAHTNIVRITANGRDVYQRAQQPHAQEQAAPAIHSYTLAQLHSYALAVPAEELAFIREAFAMNYALCKAGLASEKTSFARCLLAANGGQVISQNEQKTASLLCNAAIEARVLGLPLPAMSVTGSGAHGIIATMPLYAAHLVSGCPEPLLLRAAALSCLVCMYIKEYSGKLSAFCGCAIAAGAGTACGLVLLRGGDTQAMARALNNLAGSITGMICDGGNQGCVMKGVVAVDAVWQAVGLAMQNAAIGAVHGINGATPEQTMRNMGYIASPGMAGTEKAILDILQQKRAGAAQ